MPGGCGDVKNLEFHWALVAAYLQVNKMSVFVCVNLFEVATNLVVLGVSFETLFCVFCAI